MPRWLIVGCLVVALLLNGCMSLRDVREQLNPESWWDEHAVATVAVCGGVVVAAVAGGIALWLLWGEAENHTSRGQPRQADLGTASQ